MLSFFKRVVKLVIGRNLSDDSKHLFKASKSNILRLKGIGYANQVAAIVSLPAVDRPTANRVANELFGLHTRKTISNLKAGQVFLQAHPSMEQRHAYATDLAYALLSAPAVLRRFMLYGSRW